MIVSDKGRKTERCESVREARRRAVRDEGWKLAAGCGVPMSPGVETSFYTLVQQH